MTFTCEPKLLEYMNQKNRHTVIVEIAKSDSSDFEVVELHVHLIDEKQADYFQKKQHFIRKETDFGAVLLPPYKLEYEPEVFFGLKSFGPVRWMTYRGIQL